MKKSILVLMAILLSLSLFAIEFKNTIWIARSNVTTFHDNGRKGGVEYDAGEFGVIKEDGNRVYIAKFWYFKSEDVTHNPLESTIWWEGLYWGSADFSSLWSALSFVTEDHAIVSALLKDLSKSLLTNDCRCEDFSEARIIQLLMEYTNRATTDDFKFIFPITMNEWQLAIGTDWELFGLHPESLWDAVRMSSYNEDITRYIIADMIALKLVDPAEFTKMSENRILEILTEYDKIKMK